MSLPPAYLNEIELLNQEILKSQPTDVLQFCAHFFGKRLESQRVEFLLSFPISPSQFDTSESKMSGSTFPGRLGTNANPFGGKEQLSSGAISKVMEEDENDTITSPTTPSFGFSKGGGSAFGGSFGGDASGEGPPSSFKATSGEGFPAHYGMGRRTSVSAESLNPTASSNDNWTPPLPPKIRRSDRAVEEIYLGEFSLQPPRR
jgi:cAMP-dependent protein kinase regulator